MSRRTDKAKLQSAMEYLMTYGWAILIIAVVLGTLFQLGVFNSTNFSPRAPPGSCRVVRLAGTVNLEGVCSGQLPQFVAMFNGITGSHTYIDAGNGGSLQLSTFTVEAWINANPDVTAFRAIVSKETSMTNRNYWLELDQTTGYLSLRFSVGGASKTFSSTTALNDNKWHEVVATYDGAYVNLYVDGVSVITPITQTGTPDNPSADVMIGYETSGPSRFGGLISNVQIYNASLDANQIKALYIEGIGGAPVSLRSLVGWWPLNGDANDYSGNNNIGVPTGISYINQWLNGYTPP